MAIAVLISYHRSGFEVWGYKSPSIRLALRGEEMGEQFENWKGGDAKPVDAFAVRITREIMGDDGCSKMSSYIVYSTRMIVHERASGLRCSSDAPLRLTHTQV